MKEYLPLFQAGCGRVQNYPICESLKPAGNLCHNLLRRAVSGKVLAAFGLTGHEGGDAEVDGYLERQINRWSGQWEKSKTSDVVEIDELVTQLKNHLSKTSQSALVHGDY